MSTRTLTTLLITMMMSGAAIAAEETQAVLTLDDAQQASGKSAEEVKAADANGDGIIDAAEFSALELAPEEKE